MDGVEGWWDERDNEARCQECTVHQILSIFKHPKNISQKTEEKDLIENQRKGHNRKTENEKKVYKILER